MLKANPISRDIVGANTHTLVHIVAAATYSAAPTLATDGFYVAQSGSDGQYDAYELVFTITGGAADTTVTFRPWYYIVGLGGTDVWVDGKELDEIPVVGYSSDVKSATTRLNSVPVTATRAYIQVVSTGGTAPTHVNSVLYGLTGNIATVNSDIEVTVDASGSLGTVKLGDASTADLARVQPANTVHSATDDVLWVQPLGADGEVLTGGSGGAGSGAGVYSVAQGDFTAVFTAATQITLAGGPTGVIANINFIEVVQQPVAGVAVAWKPDANQFSYVPATGVLTVTGATFAVTDTYDVKVWYVPKAYDAASNQNVVHVTNPDWEQQSPNTLADATNVVNGTYPHYVDMGGYKKAGFQLILTGTLTVTLEGTMQTGAVLTALDYSDITQDTFGVANFTTTDFAVDDNGVLGLFTYVRWQVTAAGGGTDDYEIHAKRLY